MKGFTIQGIGFICFLIGAIAGTIFGTIRERKGFNKKK